MNDLRENEERPCRPGPLSVLGATSKPVFHPPAACMQVQGSSWSCCRRLPQAVTGKPVGMTVTCICAFSPPRTQLELLPQAVTALAFAEGGRLLVSAGGDTLVATWQLLDVLDAPASPTPPPPLFSWCGLWHSKHCMRCCPLLQLVDTKIAPLCLAQLYHRPCLSWVSCIWLLMASFASAIMVPGMFPMP